MKKLLVLTLALMVTLSLFTACGGNNNIPSGNSGGNNTPSGNNSTTAPPDSNGGNDNTPSGNGGDTGTGQASIMPASGWEKDPNVPYPVYKKDGASFTVYNKYYPNSYPAEINTVDQFAEYIIGTLKDNQAFASVDFGEITTATVGGREARTYAYTFYGTTETTFYMMMDDGYVYSVGYSYGEGEYDAIKDDVQSMLDSYTIK